VALKGTLIHFGAFAGKQLQLRNRPLGAKGDKNERVSGRSSRLKARYLERIGLLDLGFHVERFKVNASMATIIVIAQCLSMLASERPSFATHQASARAGPAICANVGL
jgi:hypothetical protein